jgi:hypothetical protein
MTTPAGAELSGAEIRLYDGSPGIADVGASHVGAR